MPSYTPCIIAHTMKSSPTKLKRIREQLPYSYFLFQRLHSQGHLIIQGSRSHSDTPHFSGPVISPTQRPLTDNTQYSQQRDISAPVSIRKHSPSKRETAEPRIRTRDHCYWLIITTPYLFEKNNTNSSTNAC